MQKQNYKYLNKWLVIGVLMTTTLMQYCKSPQKAIMAEQKKKEANMAYYEANIAPIMKKNCTPCHYPETGQKKMLNTFETAKDNLIDIMARVQLPSDNIKFMPFKSKKPALTATEITVFKKWMTQLSAK